MQQDTLKAYEVLGVPPGTSAKTIRQAYHDLLKTWDPELHYDNPRLREETEKKRKEIEESYRTIRFFLPELQAPHDPSDDQPRFSRDFNELSVKPKVEISRGIMGLIAAIVLVVVISLAFYLFKVGKSLTPSSDRRQPNVQE